MSSFRFDPGFDFVVLGKMTFLELGKDQFAIDAQFEPTSPGRNQGEPFDVCLVVDEDFCRQTDGL